MLPGDLVTLDDRWASVYIFPSLSQECCVDPDECEELAVREVALLVTYGTYRGRGAWFVVTGGTCGWVFDVALRPVSPC